MKRIIAFIVCLLMVLHLAPTTALPVIAEDTTTEYYAEWSIGTIRIYANPNDSVNVLYRVPSDFYSSTFTVKYHGNVNGKDWYYATDVYWNYNTWNNDHRYIPASSINILGVVQPEITYGEIKAMLNDGFEVTIDGAPTDATINLSKVDSESWNDDALEFANERMYGIYGAYDISISHNGEEWQPEEGNPVTVTTNVASMGFFTDDRVCVMNVHEDENGNKSLRLLGNYVVKNGVISFKTDRFSEHYFATTAVTFSATNNEQANVQVIPGASFRVVGRGNYDVTISNFSESSGTNMITFSESIVTISRDAVPGTTATFTASWKATVLFFTRNRSTTVKVTVVSKDDAIQNDLSSHRIKISILRQEEDYFPPEPTDTEGDYKNITINDAAQQKYNIVDSGNLGTDASQFLNEEFVNYPGWLMDPSGSDTYGLVDPTGYYTKNAFIKNGVSTVNWDNVKLAIVEYNEEANEEDDIKVRFLMQTVDTNGNITESSKSVVLVNNPNATFDKVDWAKDTNPQVHYEEFELIPYVIKHTLDGSYSETSGTLSWNIDVAVVHSSNIVLGYDMNLAGWTLNNKEAETRMKFLPSTRVYQSNTGSVTVPISLADAVPNDPTEDGTRVNGDWVVDGTKINVVHPIDSSKTGNLTFIGWCTAPTVSEEHPLLKDFSRGSSANNDVRQNITISNDTILYAIWKQPDDWVIKNNVINLSNTVALQPGSPHGAALPLPGETNFAYFEYNIDLKFNTTGKYKDVRFEINRYVEDAGVWKKKNEIVSLVDVFASDSNYSYIDIVENTSIIIRLANGENARFLDVPVIEDSTLNTNTTFIITQTIDSSWNGKYSADASSSVLTKTLQVAMSEVAESRADFANYYIPPVVGLHIITENGGENEAYIFEITSTIKNFDAIRVVVPAGSEVTITKCLTGNYEIKCISAWDTLYSTSTTSATVTLTEGKDSYVTFTYSFNGKKYIYGYSHSTKTVREG